MMHESVGQIWHPKNFFFIGTIKIFEVPNLAHWLMHHQYSIKKWDHSFETFACSSTFNSVLVYAKVSLDKNSCIKNEQKRKYLILPDTIHLHTLSAPLLQYASWIDSGPWQNSIFWAIVHFLRFLFNELHSKSYFEK